MACLEEAGVGINVVGQTIPHPYLLQPSLISTSGIPRYARISIWATRLAEVLSRAPVEQGSVGAGIGATVGKLYGAEQGMKGGVGSRFRRVR